MAESPMLPANTPPDRTIVYITLRRGATPVRLRIVQKLPITFSWGVNHVHLSPFTNAPLQFFQNGHHFGLHNAE